MPQTNKDDVVVPTLSEVRVDSCRIVDCIWQVSAPIDLDYRSAMRLLNDGLWPYCHAMEKGPAHDFLERQLMDANEELSDITSPWNYHFGPDRDRLMATEDASEAKRIIADLERHLYETLPADADKAKRLSLHLSGLAALLGIAIPGHGCALAETSNINDAGRPLDRDLS